MNYFVEEIKKTISLQAQSPVICGEDFIKVKETDPNAKLRAVTFTHFKTDDAKFGFALELKTKKQLSYFVNREFYNKGCDAVILVGRENRLYVLLCELKSNRPSPKDYINQLRNSEAFIHYLINAIRLIGGYKNIEFDKISILRLLFDTENYNKGSISPKSNYPQKLREGTYKVDCSPGEKSKFCIDKFIDLINSTRMRNKKFSGVPFSVLE